MVNLTQVEAKIMDQEILCKKMQELVRSEFHLAQMLIPRQSRKLNFEEIFSKGNSGIAEQVSSCLQLTLCVF